MTASTAPLSASQVEGDTRAHAVKSSTLEPLRELWVPQPAPWLNSNDRRHRMAQAKITKAWREAAATVAEGLPTLEKPVRIVAQVWKSRLGDYDAGNLYPTAKACVDGYQDAGLLLEDNNRYVIGPDMRHGGKGEPGLYFLITELLEITVLTQ